MLVNAREWRNNASEVALPTLLPVSKARSNARWQGRSLAFKTRWRMCFSGFRTSRSPSFVFMQTFSLFLLLTDKTRTAVKAIYLLIYKKKNSVQFIFFHILWMAIFLSFYFSTVSSSRRCWSLDLVRVCLFVMSIFTPPFFVCLFVFFLLFFSISFPMRVFFPLFWAESDDNA